MALQKVVKEKVPYHARVYPMYSYLRGSNYRSGGVIDYDDKLQKEPDDMIEDRDINDDNAGRNEYHGEKAPLAEISRARLGADKEFEGYETLLDDMFVHNWYNGLISHFEYDIRRNNWSIKDLKIFHVWYASLNQKPNSHSWTAKFHSVTKKIELEIHCHEKNEDGVNQTKVVFLDTNDCDKAKFATVDDCEVKYSLFSNACRVKLEIRSYNDDGSPARNVKGRVHAYSSYGGTKYEKYLLGGKTEYAQSEYVVGSDSLMICPDLILPLDIPLLELEMSLTDDTGNFLFNDDHVVIHPRSIVVDEQLHSLGRKGYIILSAIWACLCVESDQGVCTCPGIAFGFPIENNDSGEDTKDGSIIIDTCHPIMTWDEDGIECRTKRAKINQSSGSSQQTTIGEMEE